MEKLDIGTQKYFKQDCAQILYKKYTLKTSVTLSIRTKAIVNYNHTVVVYLIKTNNSIEFN